MKHFQLLVVAVALLDFCLAVQPPQDNVSGQGRSAASPATQPPAAVTPAAAVLNPSQSVQKTLLRAGRNALAEGNDGRHTGEASAAAQAQVTSLLPGEGGVPEDISSSSTSEAVPDENKSEQDENSRTTLEKLLAEATVVQGEAARSSSQREEKPRRPPRRRNPQEVPFPPPSSAVTRSLKDDVETPMTLDDVFSQIAKVSLFSRKTSSRVPMTPRKRIIKRPVRRKKSRWGSFTKNPDSDSDDDSPILAVMPRQPFHVPYQISNGKWPSSETEHSNTPQAALHQLLSDTAGSMGIGAWTIVGPSEQPAEEPKPREEEVPALPPKDSRDTLEDLLQQATATIASARRRKKRRNRRLGKKYSKMSKGQGGKDDEPILAVLPRRAESSHTSTSIQESIEPPPENLLNQTANPQEALQQMLANSMGFASWDETEENPEENPDTVAKVEGSEESKEGNPAHVTKDSSTVSSDGPQPQAVQGLNSSENALGPQPTNTLENIKSPETNENAETISEPSPLTPRKAAAAAAAWDMKLLTSVARKTAATAKAARVAASLARGISALPGPEKGQMPRFQFRRTAIPLKWEEDESISEETTTESDESQSSDASTPAGAWDTSSLPSDGADEGFKGLSHPQWPPVSPTMTELPGSSQSDGSPSSVLFPSQQALLMGSADRTPHSSGQYAEDPDFGKETLWEDPTPFGALHEGPEEFAAANLLGTPTGGVVQAAQQMQQENFSAAGPHVLRNAKDPLEGSSQTLFPSPVQRNAATADKFQPPASPVPRMEGPHHPGGGSFEDEEGSADNPFTLSGGWGPATVFGLMMVVGLFAGLGMWLRSQCAKRANKNAAKDKDCSFTHSSIWATSAELSATA